jgi:limonene-1,2-epoxide hydrolase
MYSASQQLKNAELVRNLLENRDKANYFDNFDTKARVWADSRSDNPVVWGNDEVHIGPEGMKKMSEAYSNKGYTYEIIVHDIYTSGCVVVVSRTDIRKEAGKPDKPIPATGVFAIKNGKIIEWCDYYR